jgi:hypothetical protein
MRGAPAQVNVPLYLPLQSMSVQSLLKRAVYAVNGMSGTELNPNFLQQITEKIPDKSTPIGVMCMSGGTVEASSTGGALLSRSVRSPGPRLSRLCPVCSACSKLPLTSADQ